MEKKDLSRQAKNCLKLFALQNPATIEKALSCLSAPVLNELKEFCKETDLPSLAIRLGLRAYA